MMKLELLGRHIGHIKNILGHKYEIKLKLKTKADRVASHWEIDPFLYGMENTFELLPMTYSGFFF